MTTALRQRLSIVCLALLPFHALLVTVGTLWILGPSHAPLAALALWKELLLLVIVSLALAEFLQKPQWSFDRVDAVIIALLALSDIVTIFTYRSLGQYALGFKYDLLPLIIFLIARRVPWSDSVRSHVRILLMVIGSIVAGYGIVSLLLPDTFFTWLGYSDMHSLYQPHAPLAAFQHIESSTLRRIQSVMSGPNQLGLWLLLPLSMCLTQRRGSLRFPLLPGVCIMLCSTALFLTYSRTALIATTVLVGSAVFLQYSKHRKQIVGWGVAMALGILCVIAIWAPQTVIRSASTSDHLRKPLHALQMMVLHPWGFGLGTAGPASNRFSDACVFLPTGSDISWARNHPDLCAFINNEQVLPEGKICQCPLVTENWYLQLGVELGWLGMALWILLMIFTAQLLFRATQSSANFPSILPLFLALATAALFLHAWEDAAVSYSMWLLLAMELQSTFIRHQQRRV